MIEHILQFSCVYKIHRPPTQHATLLCSVTPLLQIPLLTLSNKIVTKADEQWRMIYKQQWRSLAHLVTTILQPSRPELFPMLYKVLLMTNGGCNQDRNPVRHSAIRVRLCSISHDWLSTNKHSPSIESRNCWSKSCILIKLQKHYLKQAQHW